jgi:hypothetical protein
MIEPCTKTNPCRMRVDWHGGSFEWGWTDWLGLIALTMAAAFLVTVIVALRRGEPPLKVLRYISGSFGSLFRSGSN